MNLIFAHGILGFRQRFGIAYFRGVQDHFEQVGAKVLIPEVNPTAGIKVRGEELRTQILDAFGKGPLDPGQPTHIVAHSMGGLDSRFMLSPANKNTTSQNDLSGRVRSLTTIGTPHRGSPIADLVALRTVEELDPFKHIGGIIDHFGISQNALEEILNHLGISTEGLLNLTTKFLTQFNEEFRDHPKVHYFSVAGQGRPVLPQTAGVFFPLYLYIKAQTGEANDGLVTVSSARWREFDSELWSADHGEEVGHNLDNLAVPGAFNHFDKYDQIVKRISSI